MRPHVQSVPRIVAPLGWRPLLLAAVLVMFVVGAGASASAQSTLPVLWTATNSGAGNGVRIASDAAGNVAVVSDNFNLVVTSYTAAGTFRWSNTVPNNPGWLRANWVAVAPNGDFVVAGSRVSTQTGLPYEAIVIRYSNTGTQLWRRDIQTFGGRYGCVVGRLIVDAAGNTYLVGSFVGPNVDATILKYSPTGTLLWSRKDSTIANSVALSPDGADVIVTGFVPGSFSLQVAAHDATTGALRWFANTPEAGGGRDVVVDATRVYVTGQSVTNPGTPSMYYSMTVIAYDRVTGARLWRTDSRPPPPSQAAGYWIAPAPDGGLVAAGSASASSYLNWWIMALDRNGTLRWQATRDRAVTGDEMPNSVFVKGDGTTVVSGVGGPNVTDPLGNVYLQGVTAGYSSTGTLLWEGFAPVALSWAIPVPNGDVVATGGLDARTTAWRPPAGTGPPAAPTNLAATALSRSSIGLTWTNGAIAQAEVRVERCRGSSCTNFAEVATVPGTATTFTDEGLSSRRTYRYRVRAWNTAGFSPYSNIASARTP